MAKVTNKKPALKRHKKEQQKNQQQKNGCKQVLQ